MMKPLFFLALVLLLGCSITHRDRPTSITTEGVPDRELRVTKIQPGASLTITRGGHIVSYAGRGKSILSSDGEVLSYPLLIHPGDSIRMIEKPKARVVVKPEKVHQPPPRVLKGPPF